MKTKKGFTLVELIAVIALIAVIIAIAGISIISIKNNTLKGQRNNLRSTIKIAAKEYHEETGVEIVPVLVLIQTGRIEADEFDSNGDPVIYDPYDKKVINCECVSFKDSEDGKWDSKTDGCDPAIIANEVNINYIYSDEGATAKTYTAAKENEWFAMGDNQTLQFIGAIDKVDGKEVEYTWINPSAPDFAIEGRTFDVELPELGYIESAYTVNANFNGYYASKTFGIKVDGKKPILENYYIENLENWSSSKNLHAEFTDNESGIYGYYLTSSEGNCSKTFSKYKTNDESGNLIKGKSTFILNEDITKNGNLSICLIDIAGNVTKSDQYLVSNIDNTDPLIELAVVNGTTYYKNNNVTVTLRDGIPEDASQKTTGISGFTESSYTVKYKWSTTSINCSDISSSNTITLTDPDGDGVYTGSKSIGSGTGKGKIYVCPSGTIADQAGNSVANTPVKETMYLDNTAPTCADGFVGQTKWTSSASRTTKVECADKGSGCKKGANYNKETTVASGKVQKEDSLIIYDEAGNKGTCTFDVLIDREKPTCTTSGGGTSDSYKEKRDINVSCSDGMGSGCDSTSYQSKISYKATTSISYTTDTITVKDIAGNSNSCTANVYVCKTGDWKDDGTCSSDGYQKQKRESSCAVSKTRTIGCESDEDCGSWSSCAGSCGTTGKKTQKCTYYYNGEEKERTNTKTCSMPSCIPPSSSGWTCDIQGSTNLSLPFTWSNCTGKDGTHDHGYLIYCRNEKGYVKTAKSLGMSATLWCPNSGGADTRYVIDDSGVYAEYSASAGHTVYYNAYEGSSPTVIQVRTKWN